MREKDKIRNDIIVKMLGDLERLHKDNEIGEDTYTELKAKYERELEEIDEYYDFADLGDMIREKVEASLQKAFKNSFKGKKGYFDNEFIKEETLKGKFDFSDVNIDFRVENGRIEIKKSDTDEYLVLIRKRAKARGREEAERAFDEIDLSIEQENDRLAVHASEMVDIVAALPARSYTITAESENGSISLSDLSGEESTLKTENGALVITEVEFERLDGWTENGRVEIKDVKGTAVHAVTENGSVVLEDLSVDELTADTENGRISSSCEAKKMRLTTERGSITASISAGENDVRTELGSIKIKVPEGTKAYIEARTDLGRIKAEGTIVNSENGYKKIIFNENGSEEAKIRIKTDMGSIKIMKS